MKTSSFIVAVVGLISNVILTVLKIVAGVVFKSQVLLADGIHNAGDIVASLVAFLSMKVSNQPPDDEHPYGHGKAEVLGAMFVAFVLGLAGLFMAYHSFESLFTPSHIVFVFSIYIAALSLIWKYILYVYTMKIGKAEKSKALIATAHDHLADVYASLAAVIGIGLSIIGDKLDLPLLMLGDPLSGIVVSVLVLKLAYDMARESVDVLMEKNVQEVQLDEYAKVVMELPQVKRMDRIRAREHGHYILVDVRVGVSGNITVQEGHDISRQIKKNIMDKDEDVYEVLVHLNPWYEHESNIV